MVFSQKESIEFQVNKAEPGGGGGTVVEGRGGGLNCSICGKGFRRQKALDSHMSVSHPRDNEIEEFSEPEDMMEGLRHVVNIGSGDEEHTENTEKIRCGLKQLVLSKKSRFNPDWLSKTLKNSLWNTNFLRMYC